MVGGAFEKMGLPEIGEAFTKVGTAVTIAGGAINAVGSIMSFAGNIAGSLITSMLSLSAA
jgi:hypothetical protein